MRACRHYNNPAIKLHNSQEYLFFILPHAPSRRVLNLISQPREAKATSTLHHTEIILPLIDLQIEIQVHYITLMRDHC